jgi:hypothetical protein
MAEQPTLSAYSSAPVLDIISYGYRHMFQWLKPLTLLTLPFLIVLGTLAAVFAQDLNPWSPRLNRCRC